jgi:hypothetical protein
MCSLYVLYMYCIFTVYVLYMYLKNLKNFLVDQYSGTMPESYKLKSKLESKMTFDMGFSRFLRPCRQ